MGLLFYTPERDAAAALMPVVLIDSDWSCTECNMAFESKQALITHEVRYHRRLRLARSKVGTNTCPICLRTFGSRTKVMEHLHNKSEICLVNYMLYQETLSEEEVEELN